MLFVKHLLLAQAAAENQKKGKPGQLVDPRPQTVDGEIKIVITPQLVHDIFEEYPVVAKAYDENVPSKVRTLHVAVFFLDNIVLNDRKFSCQKRTSGNDIFNLSSSTRIEHPFVLLLHSMLSKMTLYSTSISRKMTTVSHIECCA